MKKIWFVLLISSIAYSCGEDDGPSIGDNFDRGTMLGNWADNIIVPAYQAYASDLSALSSATNTFVGDINETNLSNLRAAWLQAYTSWQRVSMFEIGRAETITLRDFTNIFPTSAASIDASITSGSWNLELPSSRDQQGFPAMDYLLHGIDVSDAGIVTKFQNDQNYQTYLQDIVARLIDLTDQVVDDWQNGYRDEFVGNDGSSASSSVNKMVNDYMFYYEKAFRAGKVGIPAGVFSGSPLSDRVEAFYAQDVSKVLFDEALQATIDFFIGKHFGNTGQGESLKSYLDFLQTISDGENLSDLINSQFLEAQSASGNLQNNFSEAVENNNTLMLGLYDELQANVVLLKVDMFQALSIQVDFVDADGD